MKTFFCNRTVDKSEMKRLIKWVLLNYGSQKATCLVDQLKTLGFHYATHAGISLGIDDLCIPPVKASLLLNADTEIAENETRWARGQVTAVDRLKKALDVWNTTNDTLKNAVIDHFRETDVFNPVYMMAFSGARGNISQVRQLVGMRGLMADPQGQILDFPIRRNFREGLTVTEYMISCYGARKGLVDTALRTANSGYLTRRLVDVAQNVIIQHVDCYPSRGLSVPTSDPRFEDKVIGRVLFRDVIQEDTGQLLARKNTDISSFVAQNIRSADYVMVRSPLTCNFQSVCQLCYGWSLAQQQLVQLGEAVGVLAAQSIGEPGTQLTMRTFHTGGVFAGEATEKVYSPHAGKIEYLSNLRGHKVTTYYGETAFLSLSQVQLRIRRRQGYQSAILEFPPMTLLFARPGEYVNYYQSVAELSRVDWEATKATRQLGAPQLPKVQEGPIKQAKADSDGQIYQEFENSAARCYQNTAHPSHGTWLWDFQNQQTHRLWNIAGQFQPVARLARGDTWTQECQRFLSPTQPLVSVGEYGASGKRQPYDPRFDNLVVKSVMPRPAGGYLNVKPLVRGLSRASSLHISDSRRLTEPDLAYLLMAYNLSSSPSLDPEFSLHATYPTNPYPAQKVYGGSMSLSNVSICQTWDTRDTQVRSSLELTYEKATQESAPRRQIHSSAIKFETRGHEPLVKTTSATHSRGSQMKGHFQSYTRLQRVATKKLRVDRHLDMHRMQYSRTQYCGPLLSKLSVRDQVQYLTNTTFGPHVPCFTHSLFGVLQVSSLDRAWVNWQTCLLARAGEPNQVLELPVDIRCYQSSLCSPHYAHKLFPYEFERAPALPNHPVQWRAASGFGSKQMRSLSQPFSSVPQAYRMRGLASQGEYRLEHPGIAEQLAGLCEQEELNELLAYLLMKERQKLHLFNLISKTDPLPRLLPRWRKMGIEVFEGEVLGVNIREVILASTRRSTHQLVPGTIRPSKYEPLCLTPEVQKCFAIGKRLLQATVGSFVRQDDAITKTSRLPLSGQLIVRRAQHMVFRRVQAYKVLAGCNMVLHVKHGMSVRAGTPLLSIPSVESTAGDIVQGLPKVDELLEARETTVAGPSGQNMHQILSSVFGQYAALYGMRLGCEYSFHVIRQQLVHEVQAVYQSQGVYISDKHVEIIVRQMTGKVFIIDSGTTRLLPGDIVDFRRVERMATQGINTRKQLQYRPILLGITRASLAAESFIAAASFQETKRVLARSALEGRMDWLMGLKENVILGRLIPAGTGFYFG